VLVLAANGLCHSCLGFALDAPGKDAAGISASRNCSPASFQPVVPLVVAAGGASPVKLQNGHTAANGAANSASGAASAANGRPSSSPATNGLLNGAASNYMAAANGGNSPSPVASPRALSSPHGGAARPLERSNSSSSADSQRASNGAPAALAWLMSSPRRSPATASSPLRPSERSTERCTL